MTTDPGRYELQPMYEVRLAGVAFEVLERLATPDVARAARIVIEHDAALDRAAEHAVAELSGDPDRKRRNRVRKLLDRRASVAAELASGLASLARFETARVARELASTELATILADALGRTRTALRALAADVLPPFAVFASDELFDRIAEVAADPDAGRPTSDARRLERHLALCLQRLCAKNDTVSEFGPSSWGRVADATEAVAFAPQPGIARRIAYLEKWVVVALVAAINADPEVRAELAPRLHPYGAWDGDRFVRDDTSEVIDLDPRALSLARSCDGRTPAHELGALDVLATLADRGVIVWTFEVPYLATDRMERLIADVASWRAGAVRDRWHAQLVDLAALPHELAATPDADQRRSIMARARERVAAFGGTVASRGRGLYEAANPIGEDCHRETSMVVSSAAADELVRDAAPWIDLWFDTYALAASHAYARLAEIHATAPRRGGHLRLPAFLRHCELGGVPYGRTGPATLVDRAFQQVKEAFRAATQHRADASEWELTADECRCVRTRYEVPRFESFAWPNADVQLAAASREAAARGEYQWVLAELHGSFALLQHLFYWSCPDPGAFAEQLQPLYGGTVTCAGEAMYDLATHVTVRLFDAMPAQTVFCGPQRPDPSWRTIAPTELEVVAHPDEHDLRLRHIASGQDLGSLVRHGLLFFGFHPFVLGRDGHTPRLRLGRVIVQREMWHVDAEELGGPFEGVSPSLVVAVERLRARRGLPRCVYIRPAEGILSRSVRGARDKDVKPIFIDLESYTFLEIFAQWLKKFGRIEVSEMLPDRDQLLWQEADGRRSFELRALVGPRGRPK